MFISDLSIKDLSLCLWLDSEEIVGSISDATCEKKN